jgi:hypothetical protein
MTNTALREPPAGVEDPCVVTIQLLSLRPVPASSVARLRQPGREAPDLFRLMPLIFRNARVLRVLPSGGSRRAGSYIAHWEFIRITVDPHPREPPEYVRFDWISAAQSRRGGVITVIEQA